MAAPGTLKRPAYSLYQWFWAGLDWLYPPSCGGCGKLGLRWCQKCEQATQLIFNACQRCGRPLEKMGICKDCLASPPPLKALRSWAAFGGPLREALHRLKYEGDVALGEVLARPLIKIVLESDWRIDLVTAVPMGIARRAQRGYNQASLLAFPLALGCGKLFRPGALEKVRETRSQVGLTAAERRENVARAFRAEARVVREKQVLVVDDVTTSGATLMSCANALIEAGASQVYGLTLARTVLADRPEMDAQ